eukprot:CAMPEP_0197035402 /NCGR_PEP_ID=MMETSP1384-20130603/13220_1 /TAXON_ID=29189 /ORGANISM="Ammonia sp." /LENGTH=118 /DNA_ID=CAMNT_0042465467 /DNA_START=55 /DNA_END=411 /DNA_ORIENTATION=+
MAAIAEPVAKAQQNGDEIGEDEWIEWPFDDKNPGAVAVYNEAIEKNYDKHSARVFIFPEDNKYAGYMVRFEPNNKKGGILDELIQKFVKRFPCRVQGCRQRFTNEADRDQHEQTHQQQ